jgi:hypothetical protein
LNSLYRHNIELSKFRRKKIDMKLAKKLFSRRRSNLKVIQGCLKDRSTSSTSSTISKERADKVKPIADKSTSPPPDAEEPVLSTLELQAIHASLAKRKGLPALSGESDPTEMKRLIAVAHVLWRMCNSHNLLATKALMTDDADIQYFDSGKSLDVEMPWHIWGEEMAKIGASFPDFSFSCDRVSYVPGVVILHGCRSGGTHTGSSYACGPCEAIHASGKKVLNGPEEIYLFFREGEDAICRMVTCAKGEMSGPGGIYTQFCGFPLM